MSRDRVKTQLAADLKRAIRQASNGIRYSLKDQQVQDVEVESISELETQVKLKFTNIPPRYFLVKVSEKI